MTAAPVLETPTPDAPSGLPDDEPEATPLGVPEDAPEAEPGEESMPGIVTDGDLRRHMEGLLGRRAGEVMTRHPLTIAPDRLAEEAVGLMNARRITCLFVVDPAEPGRVEGLLHIHDCLRAGLG